MRCASPTSKHRIPYVAVSHKNAEPRISSGEVSSQIDPAYNQVPAELIAPMDRRVCELDSANFVRDCPKRGQSNAPKVDSDVMRRSKWYEKSLLGDL